MQQNTQVIEKQAADAQRDSHANVVNRSRAPAAESSRPNGDSQTNAAGSGLLLASLQRLYDNGAGAAIPAEVQQNAGSHPDDLEYQLSASLLEAVFEISDFDPLPQLGLAVQELGLTQRIDRHHADPPANVKPWPTARDGQTTPAAPAKSTPVAIAGSDRRKLPRRESECLISVFVCTTDEHLTSDRIAWLLHATQLKGTLVDVSMSGIAFQLSEPLPADAKVLLRIKNRTIDEHVDATAYVLRSSPSGDSGWTIVCRFGRNLTFEQIHVVGRSLFAATIV